MLISADGVAIGMPRVQFLICGSCFWCASTLTDKAIADRCPCCCMIESIPVTAGEKYRFDHSAKGGVALEFA